MFQYHSRLRAGLLALAIAASGMTMPLSVAHADCSFCCRIIVICG
jgi:hypothetical protein